MSATVDATHPHYVLDHLVKVVLPKRCKTDAVRDYYKDQLNDPEGTIAQCKYFLKDWVLELSAAGTLRDVDALRTIFATQFPRHGIIYVIILIVNGEPWYYVGQSHDGWKRVVDSHLKPSYRVNQPCFLYYLWERASEVLICLPVSDIALSSGPLMNILEQWLSLLFRGLQPMELKQNFALDTLQQIPSAELQHGVGVREPLAQGFGFKDYPIKNIAFRWSKEPLKLAYLDWKRNQVASDRAETLLRGDLYGGAFTEHHEDYRIYLGGLQIDVPRFFLHRIVSATFRVKCDLVPVGQKHPQMYIAGMYSPSKWDDPARRVGIKVSGLRACDGEEEVLWLRKEFADSDLWIPHINRLVDWLESKNLDEIRPRRFYNDLTQKYKGRFTRHPVDFKDGSDEWKTLITFEEFE